MTILERRQTRFARLRKVMNRGLLAAGGAATILAVLPLGEPSAQSAQGNISTRAVVVVSSHKRVGMALAASAHSAPIGSETSRQAGGEGTGSGHLIYGGSALMQRVKLFQVIWGAPGPGRTYIPEVTDGSLAKAYKVYVEGGAFDWVSSEYSTLLYKIGRGKFAGTVTLNLLRPNSRRSHVYDGDIEAEISAQIDAHVLAADPNAMLMINFPAEVNVTMGSADYGYGRGVGTVPIGCADGKQDDAGLCYPPCNSGFVGVGPVCWGPCPPDHHNDGATCRKDVQIVAKSSYGRGVGTPMHADCGSKELDAGLCYNRCPAGFHGVGPVCWQNCPDGYHDDGATCRLDAHIISSDNSKCPWYDKCGLVSAKGCSHCPDGQGYHNDGCTCRRDVRIVGKRTVGRGVGTVPAYGCGVNDQDAGLCYTPCRAGFHGVGPICWSACPAGFHDDGATCRIDANIVARPSFGRGVGVPRANCGQDKQYDAGLCYPLCDTDFHGVGPMCWGRDSFCRGHSGFCGYHSSFLHNAAAVRYGVLSDTGAGAACAGQCWLSDAFSAETKTFSHEFAEAATDPDLNLGWNDISNGEIGDICNSQSGPVDAGGGTQFIFQKEWSNKSNACKQ